MEIKIECRDLEEVVILVPEIFQDSRGFFMETFREDHFKALGVPHHFVQDNHSRSVKGLVRGLHFQWDPPMGKLMRVSFGTAFLVAADIRKGSPTLGQWTGVVASAENRRQVWAPAGFARAATSSPKMLRTGARWSSSRHESGPVEKKANSPKALAIRDS